MANRRGHTGQGTEIDITTASSMIQRMLGTALKKSDAEIVDRIEHELVENPALDKADDDEGAFINVITEDGKQFKETAGELNNKDYGNDDDRPQVTEHPDWVGRGGGMRSAAPDGEVYYPPVVEAQSLSDYLMEQLSERRLTERDMRLAEYVVGNIDSNGWLTRSPHAIADDATFDDATGTLGDVTTDEVEHVVSVVQSLDPAGVGARDLRECIQLQLRRKSGDAARLAERVVAECFEDFVAKKYDAICSSLNIDREQLKAAEKFIKATDPKPGAAYGGDTERHGNIITPDFTVEIDDNGRLVLTLPNKVPDLVISETYAAVASAPRSRDKTSSQKAEIDMIKEQVSRAKTFIEVLQQRQTTLFNTMRAIMHRQEEYFLTGDERILKPMVLKDIAEDVGRDVSMVSRATSNKFVQTPWGIKPLKFFFTEGIDSGDGNLVSAHAVKLALQALVENEDKNNPLSDSQIVAALSQQGFPIARRTVAKYREQLGILAAPQRRE